ncbi:MAG TPA: hypothetical protein PKX94_04990, partial [Opitutales bacterium]|nr:hypothetical protein [Opitutales bacterium]
MSRSQIQITPPWHTDWRSTLLLGAIAFSCLHPALASDQDHATVSGIQGHPLSRTYTFEDIGEVSQDLRMYIDRMG